MRAQRHTPAVIPRNKTKHITNYNLQNFPPLAQPSNPVWLPCRARKRNKPNITKNYTAVEACGRWGHPSPLTAGKPAFLQRHVAARATCRHTQAGKTAFFNRDTWPPEPHVATLKQAKPRSLADLQPRGRMSLKKTERNTK